MASKEIIKNLVEGAKLSSEHLDCIEKSWVVENPEGEVVGFAGIERRENIVYVQSLAVKKKYRRLGIGRRLIDKTFEAINEGDVLIALTMFWNNKFYRDSGFIHLDAKTTKAADDIAGRKKHKYCVAWGKKK